MKIQRRRTVLFFMFSALLVTVCRCQSDPFHPDIVPILFTDGSTTTCRGLTEYLENKDGGPAGTTTGYVYECTVPCPDGSDAEFDLYERPAVGKQDKEAWQEKYCTADQMVPLDVTEPPSEPSPKASSVAVSRGEAAAEGQQQLW